MLGLKLNHVSKRGHMNPTYNGYTGSSSISENANRRAKFWEDPSKNICEIPFTLHESAGHDSIYLPVIISVTTVNALLDINCG